MAKQIEDFDANLAGEEGKTEETKSSWFKRIKKGINTKEQINRLNAADAGFECDVYFDTATRSFNVHHDPDKNIGYNLEDLLLLYQQKKMNASIWLDIKNLDNSNAQSVLHSLIELRNK